MDGDETVQADAVSPESDIKKLKRANKVLKQAVLEEREKSAELTARVRQLEVVGTGKDEEIQQVGFHNNRLKKRVDALQQELADQKSSAGSSWGLGGMGWGSTLSKADAEKLQADLGMMQEQLELKIRENESLHMEMFELKAKQEAQVEKLKKKNRELKAELESEKKRAEESLLAAAVRVEMLTGERDGAVRLQEAAEVRVAEGNVALAELRREHDAAKAAAEAEQGVLQRSVALLEGQVADGATQRQRLSDALEAEEKAKSELSDRYRELQSLYDAAEHSASLEREAMRQLQERLAAARTETEAARADASSAKAAMAAAVAAAAEGNGAGGGAKVTGVEVAATHRQETPARAGGDAQEMRRVQVPDVMHPAEMERSWSNLSSSASSQLEPRQEQLLFSTPAAGDMERSGSGLLVGMVKPPSGSASGEERERATVDDDDWDSELRQEFGSPSELPDQLTGLSVASEEHTILDSQTPGVGSLQSSIGAATARLAAAEAAALAPHTGQYDTIKTTALSFSVGF
jgi:DNA repair exonuclease SbcCD ATPase subunit